MNYLGSGDNKLVHVDYQDLLEKILQKIQQKNPFNELRPQSNRIIIKLDEIAYDLYRQSIEDPIFTIHRSRSATLNFSPDFAEKFPGLVRQIRDRLRQHFHDRLNAVDFNLNNFISPLQQGNAEQLNFTYNFPSAESVPTAGLETRENGVGNDSLLKFHKLTISVSQIHQFQEQMRQGLGNYLEEQLDDEEDLEEAQEALNDLIEDRDNSDFYRLQRVVDTESLGKLKKEAKICYLEYLQNQIDPQTHPNVVYLQDLIRRLRAIEDYINDPNKTDGDYQVSYQGERLNYKDWFSRSESLDALPIIPIISDSLGETTSPDGTERTFTFGLKMKFGNPVQAYGGQDVFDYYLDILNPDNFAQVQESDRGIVARKVLRLLFLYYFVFATNSNPATSDYRLESELEYDVRDRFDTVILEVFRGNDEERKQSILRGLIQGFNTYHVRDKIKRLRNLLQNSIGRIGILPTECFRREIGVGRGILEDSQDNLTQGRIFKDVVRNPKQSLRYITIKDAHPSESTFCQLPAILQFDDIRYYQASAQEIFNIDYDRRETILQLPVLVTPDGELSRTTSRSDLAGQKMIVFGYHNRHLDRDRCDSVQGFIYRFAMSLLFYVTLQVILEELSPGNDSLLIPIFRFHEGDSNHPSRSEEFMADMSKLTAHLLNSRYLSNSQGFRIRNRDSNRLRNAFASLYSVLPQTFQFVESSPRNETPLDKLALVVVSSLESDGLPSNRDRDLGIYTLFGEAIGITNEGGNIRIQMLKTFSQNYPKQVLYRNPSILSDVVQNLHRQGYHHILYIAQAPYSNNLNLTNVRNETQFYFMSPDLIRSITSDLEDIHIYPIFFNKYYVRKSKKLVSTSYQLQDTENLLNLVKDPSQQMVVFFNLFNGITVGRGDERFYNGVMSYSTLLNIYSEVLGDRSIRQGLIYDGSLKQDILRYLTLFHFFRLERIQREPKLKLDPYEHIIGDESLRKNAVFYHMDGRSYFNNLAFLTEVDSILYPQVRREEENH